MDIKLAISRADKFDSKIDTHTMSELNGLSSPKVRHLLNNLASQSDSYLEIGVYLGGTLRAALHSNRHLYSVAIDNFSMKPQTRQNFFDNTEMLDFQFIEEDSFKVDLLLFKKKIKCFFYDGNHSFESQYNAIKYYLPVMQDEFLYICDDWEMKKIPNATFCAGKDLKLEIIESYNLYNTPGTKDWWGGIGLVWFRKR